MFQWICLVIGVILLMTARNVGVLIAGIMFLITSFVFLVDGSGF